MKWLAVLLLLFSAAAAAQETHIAAVVNNDIVTAGDLDARLRVVMASSNIPDTAENRKRLTPQILRALIDEKLQLQEAKRLSITVPQDQIDKALASIEERNHMPKGSLESYLEAHNLSKSTLVEQIKASLAFNDILRNRVSQDVTVSDDEVDDAMKRIQADVGKPQSRVSEIFLAVDNPSQEDEVRRLADRLVDDIRGGAKFPDLAQQFSQSPSAAVGGDIGWVTPGQLSPLLATAVQKMNPGEMSYPIRTPAGFYLLYVTDRRTLGVASPDQILLSLVEVVFPLALDSSPDERARVQAEAQQVSDTAKSCGEMTKIGVERAPQLSRQVPQVRASDLPEEVRPQVLALKVAEASRPLPMPGGLGVVMVCERHDPPGLPTRDQVADTLARERMDELARRYMLDLRRGAYVDIRG